jgi:hypothetical protein
MNRVHLDGKVTKINCKNKIYLSILFLLQSQYGFRSYTLAGLDLKTHSSSLLLEGVCR